MVPDIIKSEIKSYIIPGWVSGRRRRSDDAQGRHIEADGLTQIAGDSSAAQIISNVLQHLKLFVSFCRRYINIQFLTLYCN